MTIHAWYETGRADDAQIHPAADLTVGARTALIDHGIRDDIRRLWEHDIDTFTCCQGDDRLPRYVLVPNHADTAFAATLLPWWTIMRPHYDHWTMFEGPGD